MKQVVDDIYMGLKALHFTERCELITSNSLEIIALPTLRGPEIDKAVVRLDPAYFGNRGCGVTMTKTIRTRPTQAKAMLKGLLC